VVVFDLLTIIIPIALVDSASITPLCIVPLALILSSRRPYVNAAAFLLGLFVSYLVMAVAFLIGMGAVIDPLNAWLAEKLKNPQPLDLVVQIVVGAILLIFGLRIARKRQEKTAKRRAEPPISTVGAFWLAVTMNVVGFPGAVPYFAAADQILRANLPLPETLSAVLVYVVVFLVPLATLVLVRAALGKRGDVVMDKVKVFFDRWGPRILMVVLVGLGAVLVVDGVMFLFGHPLLPVPE